MKTEVREQWWDEATEAPNLSRQLVGKHLSFGDPELGQAEQVRTIQAVLGFDVGVDAAGIFACVGVETADGDVLRLYADGSVADVDDVALGRHNIKDEA